MKRGFAVVIVSIEPLVEVVNLTAEQAPLPGFEIFEPKASITDLIAESSAYTMPHASEFELWNIIRWLAIYYGPATFLEIEPQ